MVPARFICGSEALGQMQKVSSQVHHFFYRGTVAIRVPGAAAACEAHEGRGSASLEWGVQPGSQWSFVRHEFRTS